MKLQSIVLRIHITEWFIKPYKGVDYYHPAYTFLCFTLFVREIEKQ